MTGTAPFAIAVSPSGKTIVTANIAWSRSIGLDRPSITVIVPGKRDSAWNLADFNAEPRRSDPKAWQGVTTGLAVIGDNSAWISEGDTGRVVEVNLATGSRKASVTLNKDQYTSSFTDALVYDSARNLLVVLDPANSRAALIDLKRAFVVASAKTGVLPVALALSADGKRLYVVNTAPPSLSIIDLSDPTAPKNVAEVALGEMPERSEAAGVEASAAETGGPAPSGIAVHGDEVYVSLAHDDAIAIVDGKTGKAEGSIPLSIPGFEAYRGVTPLGLAFDKKAGVLLAAEAGINAVGVIDPVSRKLLGHVPVGWFPTAIDVHDGHVYVASARGFGTGPSAASHRIRMMGGARQGGFSFDLEPSALRRGSVSAFAVPTDSDLAHETDVVMEDNGFTPARTPPPEKKVPPVRYVVLIVKGDRSFDEILGDIAQAGEKQVLSWASFARFGADGYVSGGKKNFSLHVGVTPNHHEIAARWSFADNFYADSEYSSAGQHWLAGVYPDLWSETALLYHEAGNREFSPASEAPGRRLFPRGTADITPLELPRAGTVWSHLQRHQVGFRNFSGESGEAPDTQISDQARASQFIDAVRTDYLEPGKPLPRFLEIHLPNDTTGPPRPDDGFPYPASYVADNDYALGRIVEFLSRSPWWKEMAVFVTETAADGGADHIDSHRTLLLGAGPWFRTDYVSHTNASFPALLATIYKLLDVPPLNLYDATAGDLLDMFGSQPDYTPYELQPEDSRLFDPQRVK
jgi:sugar lactone lactonase YvrE